MDSGFKMKNNTNEFNYYKEKNIFNNILNNLYLKLVNCSFNYLIFYFQIYQLLFKKIFIYPK